MDGLGCKVWDLGFGGYDLCFGLVCWVLGAGSSFDVGVGFAACRVGYLIFDISY